MKNATFLAAFILIPVAGLADSGFDYGKCSTIEDVSVPYEIEVSDDIRFRHNEQLHSLVTEAGQVLDANGNPFAISQELEARLAAAVQDFVEIGTGFGLYFGHGKGWMEKISDERTDMSDELLDLFSSACRNLYELKTVQESVAALDPGFKPVVFVKGFDG